VNSPAPRDTFEVVSVRIPYRWYVALSEIAEIRNKTVSQVLREAIRLYFEEYTNIGRRMGLLDQFGNLTKQRGRK
jgi:hypothetical protein